MTVDDDILRGIFQRSQDWSSGVGVSAFLVTQDQQYVSSHGIGLVGVPGYLSSGIPEYISNPSPWLNPTYDSSGRPDEASSALWQKYVNAMQDRDSTNDPFISRTGVRFGASQGVPEVTPAGVVVSSTTTNGGAGLAVGLAALLGLALWRRRRG